MKTTSKRLLALLAGWLGLRAILRRRARSAQESPADELKAKLAATKEPEPEPAEPEPEPAEPEPGPAPDPEPQPAQQDDVDERRADAHARARHAIEELGEKRD